MFSSITIARPRPADRQHHGEQRQRDGEAEGVHEPKAPTSDTGMVTIASRAGCAGKITSTTSAIASAMVSEPIDFSMNTDVVGDDQPHAGRQPDIHPSTSARTALDRSADWTPPA
jgi:hypothetical protein